MFCPKCGTNVPDQFNFCFKCGFDLSAIRSSMNDSAPTEQSTVIKKDEANKTNVPCDNIEKAKDIGKYNNFPDLNDSLDDLTEKYMNIIYIEHDFAKAISLTSEYVQKYGNEEAVQKLDYYDDLYGYLFGNSVLASQNFLDSYKQFLTLGWTDEDFSEDFNDIITLATTCVADGYWKNCFGMRHFFVVSKQYEMNQYFDKITELRNEAATATRNNAPETLIHDIAQKCINYEDSFKNKYGLEMKYETFAKLTSDVCDLEHIQIDLNAYLEVYSYYISDIYKWILGNAIKLHNAEYLRKLYPTKEQENQYAGMVQNKLRSGWGLFNSKLTLASRNKDKINSLYNQITKMSESLNVSSIGKDVALTTLFGIISGPMGIANAVRKGVDYYQTDKKIDEARKELPQVYDAYCKEIDNLSDASFEAYKKTYEGIEELNKKYLRPALTNIFLTLKKNGEQIKPLSFYIDAN